MPVENPSCRAPQAGLANEPPTTPTPLTRPELLAATAIIEVRYPNHKLVTRLHQAALAAPPTEER